MSRVDCISNRNIKIIATYIKNRIGSYHQLFENLPYPSTQYNRPEDFFLNEDEWTTYENFETIFRRAKNLAGEPFFYFNCGASSARLASWGRLNYFSRIFTSPGDGYKRLPFFNKNFNDTKDIVIIRPPFYDSLTGKMKVTLLVRFHDDMDPNQDYIGDPYLRGILSSIPTIWGQSPAIIEQTLNPYDPTILLNKEPEFSTFKLKAKLHNNLLYVNDPSSNMTVQAGRKVILIPEQVNGHAVYLGKYEELNGFDRINPAEEVTGILITRTVRRGNRIFLKQGEIFMAPYFVLEISYDRLSLMNRLAQATKLHSRINAPESELIETIDQLRESIRAKNEAYRALETTHKKLEATKRRLDEYASELERKVEERTANLLKVKNDLLKLNQELEARVKEQLYQLKRYDELKRYVSPKLAEKILNSGQELENHLQRKFMTVVFSDIRGFSTLTDSLEPEEIFDLLNNYLKEMIKIIHTYEGTLNKIMGDGLLIFFGDPVEIPDHPQRAVDMALDMQQKVSELKKDWEAFGHNLGIGIGINTGYVTVGNIGSDIHRDYTVIGNQVNVAARLESMAKPGEILISKRTFSLLKDISQAFYMGKTEIKGLHNPIEIYKVQVPQIVL